MNTKKIKKKRRTQTNIRTLISQNLKILEYEITYEAVKDQRIEKLPVKVKERLEYLYDMIFHNPKKAIIELERLIERYPYIPQFYNYLANAYLNIGEFEKSESIVLESYDKFPDYLFSKLNYAQYCIDKEEYNEIPKIFNNKFDLKLLYPRRKKFHISEVVQFAGVIGYYHAKIGDNQAAELFYNMLRKLAPKHNLTKILKRELYPSAFYSMLRKLEQIVKSST